jgi:hypothetical protein
MVAMTAACASTRGQPHAWSLRARWRRGKKRLPSEPPPAQVTPASRSTGDTPPPSPPTPSRRWARRAAVSLPPRAVKAAVAECKQALNAIVLRALAQAKRTGVAPTGEAEAQLRAARTVDAAALTQALLERDGFVFTPIAAAGVGDGGELLSAVAADVHWQRAVRNCGNYVKATAARGVVPGGAADAIAKLAPPAARLPPAAAAAAAGAPPLPAVGKKRPRAPAADAAAGEDPATEGAATEGAGGGHDAGDRVLLRSAAAYLARQAALRRRVEEVGDGAAMAAVGGLPSLPAPPPDGGRGGKVHGRGAGKGRGLAWHGEPHFDDCHPSWQCKRRTERRQAKAVTRALRAPVVPAPTIPAAATS